MIKDFAEYANTKFWIRDPGTVLVRYPFEPWILDLNIYIDILSETANKTRLWFYILFLHYSTLNQMCCIWLLFSDH